MKSGANKIPILTFHALEDRRTPISFSPDLFARAIKKWYAEGWRTISLLEGVQHLRAGKPFPEKTFVLTFDDGYASVYQHAFPLLQAYNFTATLFIAPQENVSANSTDALPVLYEREMLRWHQIREMRAHGIDFGSHTLTHRELITLDEKEIEYELRVAREVLSNALGEQIALFAYPRGLYNARVRQLTAQFYEAACSDKLGIATLKSDLFALERVETFYLRETWAADGFTGAWFPFYLQMRNVPRKMKSYLTRQKNRSAR